MTVYHRRLAIADSLFHQGGFGGAFSWVRFGIGRDSNALGSGLGGGVRCVRTG
jgi:hypothetical protein